MYLGCHTMDLKLAAFDGKPNFYNVMINRRLVGTLFYDVVERSGWYEDEDRCHFVSISNLDFDEMENIIRKCYETRNKNIPI